MATPLSFASHPRRAGSGPAEIPPHRERAANHAFRFRVLPDVNVCAAKIVEHGTGKLLRRISFQNQNGAFQRFNRLGISSYGSVQCAQIVQGLSDLRVEGTMIALNLLQSQAV